MSSMNINPIPPFEVLYEDHLITIIRRSDGYVFFRNKSADPDEFVLMHEETCLKDVPYEQE